MNVFSPENTQLHDVLKFQSIALTSKFGNAGLYSEFKIDNLIETGNQSYLVNVMNLKELDNHYDEIDEIIEFF
jgi:hypothetical protein